MQKATRQTLLAGFELFASIVAAILIVSFFTPSPEQAAAIVGILIWQLSIFSRKHPKIPVKDWVEGQKP